MTDLILAIILSTGLFILGTAGCFIHQKWSGKFIALFFILSAAIINIFSFARIYRQLGMAVLFALVCLITFLGFFLILIINLNKNNPEPDSISGQPE